MTVILDDSLTGHVSAIGGPSHDYAHGWLQLSQVRHVAAVTIGTIETLHELGLWGHYTTPLGSHPCENELP